MRRNVIARLLLIQEEIEELIEELELLSDEELLRYVEESKKDFKEGRYYTLKTEAEIEQFFSDLAKECI